MVSQAYFPAKYPPRPRPTQGMQTPCGHPQALGTARAVNLGAKAGCSPGTRHGSSSHPGAAAGGCLLLRAGVRGAYRGCRPLRLAPSWLPGLC